jgi:hypothetical protein
MAHRSTLDATPDPTIAPLARRKVASRPPRRSGTAIKRIKSTHITNITLTTNRLPQRHSISTLIFLFRINQSNGIPIRKCEDGLVGVCLVRDKKHYFDFSFFENEKDRSSKIDR